VFGKEMLEFKKIVSSYYADLAYRGLWFYELKNSLDAFINKSSNRLSGKVELELYKGNIVTLKRSSQYSLYEKRLATYGKKDLFCRDWAEGFINILGIPLKKR
jgi:argininosuccinate synthase